MEWDEMSYDFHCGGSVFLFILCHFFAWRGFVFVFFFCFVVCGLWVVFVGCGRLGGIGMGWDGIG